MKVFSRGLFVLLMLAFFILSNGNESFIEYLSLNDTFESVEKTESNSESEAEDESDVFLKLVIDLSFYLKNDLSYTVQYYQYLSDKVYPFISQPPESFLSKQFV